MIKWSKDKQYWVDFVTYAGLTLLLCVLVAALYGLVVIALAGLAALV